MQTTPRELTPRLERDIYHPGGLIHSSTGGRTDHLPLAVPVDSHVIPADVVSGIGQGNSLNGAMLLDRMFHAGPWGARAAKVAGARPPMQLPEKTTPIMAAGGEYLVRPEAVALLGREAKRIEPRKHGGKADLQAGHDAIDAFILRARRRTIATTRRLPGPVKG